MAEAEEDRGNKLKFTSSCDKMITFMGGKEIKAFKERSLTNRVLQTIRDSYNKLASQSSDCTINSEKLRDLLDEFLPILAKKKTFDKEGITNLVFYAAPRLPQEIFTSDSDIVVRFNNDPDFFVDENGKREGVKTPPSRSRWYKVEEIHDENDIKIKKTLITIHAQSQTSVIETMTHLSVVEILRKRVREILKHGSLTDESIKFLWESLGLLMNDQKKQVTQKLRFTDWTNQKITIEGAPGMATWNELKSAEKPAKTALSLAEKANKFLEGKNRPSIILFSNPYSLPNILSHYMLNKNIGEKTLRRYIKEKALEAWKKHGGKNESKTSLEALGESIKSLKTHLLDQNLTDFVIDNMIIFDLTRNKNGSFDDEIIDGFVKEFWGPKRLADLGIETVVSAEKSPTADSLYYIDFTKISNEIIENSNPLIKESFSKLKNKKTSAFFLPYLPGDLTYSTIIEMKKKIDSITTVAEVGKVAHLVVGKKQRNVREIGQVVVPNYTFTSYGDTELKRLDNQVRLEHMRIFEVLRVVSETTLMETPSVILQDEEEILYSAKKIFFDQVTNANITINMEIDQIKRAVSKMRLLLFEGDYISDHAISSRIIEEFASLGKNKVFQQITKSLDRKGRNGVHAATAAVFVALANSKKV